MSEILDITIIILLLAAIVYGSALNKKINLIRDSKKELANLFVSFDGTILSAQETIKQLKDASNIAGLELQNHIDEAKILKDDLLFLIDRANKTADNLANSNKNNAAIDKRSNLTLTKKVANKNTKTTKPRHELIEDILKKISKGEKNKDILELVEEGI